MTETKENFCAACASIPAAMVAQAAVKPEVENEVKITESSSSCNIGLWIGVGLFILVLIIVVVSLCSNSGGADPVGKPRGGRRKKKSA